LFARAGIQLVVEPGGELSDVHVDRHRILRVFANLFDNALKFTEAPGRTTVTAHAVSGSVRFSVANSGPALPQEELDRMLQPFWQAGRDDRRGAGLGLSISRSIVEAHGGSIWAEPVEGMQVQISFLLPCVNPAATGAL
jgi:signal transduction histidine kinase